MKSLFFKFKIQKRCFPCIPIATSEKLSRVWLCDGEILVSLEEAGWKAVPSSNFAWRAKLEINPGVLNLAGQSVNLSRKLEDGRGRNNVG
jgi:hypothetical protein